MRENIRPPELVGVEMIIPYALWTEDEPPEFLGESLQRQDEFEILGLHVWILARQPERHVRTLESYCFL